jgi:hypothetical protein
MAGSKTIHIGKILKPLLARTQSALAAPPTEPRSPTPRLNSRENLQRWLTPETQARIIALAAELNRDVAQITTVAINLYSVIAHNPEKHKALLATMLTEKRR